MDLATLGLAMAIVLGAGFISGLAAFGFALVAVPPLLLLYEPATVTSISILLVLITRWLILRYAWREVDWHTVATLLPTALVGTVVGLLAIRELGAGWIELIAGLVVVGSAMILLEGLTIPGASSRVAAPVAGLLSGMLATSTGMAGPPVVLLFAARRMPPQVFRGSMTIVFYLTGLLAIGLLVWDDLAGREQLQISLALLPAAVAGTWLGQRALLRFSSQQFHRLVLVLLLLTGSVAVLKAVGGLLF
ncbi:sulfite exporter TauE/SafE family protein [soil metagenome]